MGGLASYENQVSKFILEIDLDKNLQLDFLLITSDYKVMYLQLLEKHFAYKTERKHIYVKDNIHTTTFVLIYNFK